MCRQRGDTIAKSGDFVVDLDELMAGLRAGGAVMVELAEVFGRFAGAYLEAHGAAMPPSHRRAIADIIACRTQALGGHLWCCDHCEELRHVLRANQRDGYSALLEAAATAIIELARDPRFVGGTVGVLAVLHTWTQRLLYHPHVHCPVTGGGLSRDGRSWCPPVVARAGLSRERSTAGIPEPSYRVDRAGFRG
jgi:Putative transposase/Transposase zinc-binding domain